MLLADPAADPLALRARENLRRNAAALGREIALPPLSFREARDGTLTAFDNGWLAGCSVPRRAAEVMLKKTVVEGNVACLVLPNHAGQVAACRAKLADSVALIALLADETELPPILACHDFSSDVSAHKLMFAWDEASLQAIFDNHPGLPIPQQFVRIATAGPEVAEPAMKRAQSVFQAVMQSQLARIRAAQAIAPPASADWCVVGSQAFHLWDDATAVLAKAIGGETIDTAEPRTSASAHVAERVAASRAIVMANMARSDRPELAQLPRPWISWITRPRIPAFASAMPRDGLLLADASFAPHATAAGWPADRMRVAGWPIEPLPKAGGGMAMLIDLPSLAPPEVVCDFSSWRVAWEQIAHDLQADPLSLGGDPAVYLDRALRRHDIAEDKLPRDLFVQQLIAAAFAAGAAKLITARGQSLAIYGRGWDEFASTLDIRGPLTDRPAFSAAVANAAAVVDASVLTSPTMLQTVDRPIVRVAGMTLPSLVARLRSPGGAAPAAKKPLSATAIESLLSV